MDFRLDQNEAFVWVRPVIESLGFVTSSSAQIVCQIYPFKFLICSIDELADDEILVGSIEIIFPFIFVLIIFAPRLNRYLIEYTKMCLNSDELLTNYGCSSEVIACFCRYWFLIVTGFSHIVQMFFTFGDQNGWMMDSFHTYVVHPEDLIGKINCVLIANQGMNFSVLQGNHTDVQAFFIFRSIILYNCRKKFTGFSIFHHYLYRPRAIIWWNSINFNHVTEDILSVLLLN